jgi:hypothetical protein
VIKATHNPSPARPGSERETLRFVLTHIPAAACRVVSETMAMNTAEARAALERCELRFPLADVPAWAERYAYRAGDQHIIDVISPAVQARGYYVREEFLET